VHHSTLHRHRFLPKLKELHRNFTRRVVILAIVLHVLHRTHIQHSLITTTIRTLEEVEQPLEMLTTELLRVIEPSLKWMSRRQIVAWMDLTTLNPNLKARVWLDLPKMAAAARSVVGDNF
jgi:hypothetical protein